MWPKGHRSYLARPSFSGFCKGNRVEPVTHASVLRHIGRYEAFKAGELCLHEDDTKSLVNRGKHKAIHRRIELGWVFYVTKQHNRIMGRRCLNQGPNILLSRSPTSNHQNRFGVLSMKCLENLD